MYKRLKIIDYSVNYKVIIRIEIGTGLSTNTLPPYAPNESNSMFLPQMKKSSLRGYSWQKPKTSLSLIMIRYSAPPPPSPPRLFLPKALKKKKEKEGKAFFIRGRGKRQEGGGAENLIRSI